LSRELIKSEVGKENPDWLLISNLTKQIYLETQPTNPLLFKKGMINLIKCGEYRVSDITVEIKSCFDNDEYIFSDSPNELIKQLKSGVIQLEDKFIVVVTDSNTFTNKVIQNGFFVNLYKATVYNKWSKKPTKIIIKGDGVDIGFNIGELKSVIRDYQLKSILS
jgi:hypothetical protein